MWKPRRHLLPLFDEALILQAAVGENQNQGEHFNPPEEQ